MMATTAQQATMISLIPYSKNIYIIYECRCSNQRHFFIEGVYIQAARHRQEPLLNNFRNKRKIGEQHQFSFIFHDNITNLTIHFI